MSPLPMIKNGRRTSIRYSLWCERQGASRRFFARKHRHRDPVASAIPLSLSAISVRTLISGNAESVLRRIGVWILPLALACVNASISNAQMDSVSQRPASTTMIYDGFTEPQYDIMVAATEIGRLETITVQLGDHVIAGEIIGKLEDSLQVSAVRIAKMQSQMTGERDATEAEAKMNLARTRNLRVLAADGMARPDELARAETDREIALARVVASEEQQQLRRLELERYELQLERRKIRAPMNGVIAKVFHLPGEYITPSDPAVVQLLVVDKLLAVFSVPVQDIPHMKVGRPVQVYLRSLSTTFDANITSIAPDIDGESGTVQVRVELDNSEGRLLAGDRCTMQLPAESDASQPSYPSASTRRWGANRR